MLILINMMMISIITVVLNSLSVLEYRICIVLLQGSGFRREGIGWDDRTNLNLS